MLRPKPLGKCSKAPGSIAGGRLSDAGRLIRLLTMLSSRVCAIVLAATIFVVAGCNYNATAVSTSTPATTRTAQETLSPPVPKSNHPVFTDASADSGLHYAWSIAGPRPVNILQSIGNGCAFLDFDNDGNLDIALIGPRLALYKGDGHGKFVDVTHETGLDKLHGNFLGCAVGDYDNDGFPDIYISGYHCGALLHNEEGLDDSGGRSVAHRRFVDVSKSAGIPSQPWGSSCTFTDIDNDGRLDLYVGNYVQFEPSSKQLCETLGTKTACPPGAYQAEVGKVYRNIRGGKFRDVTKEWGFDKAHGKALAVAAAPLGFGKGPTLAIANDAIPGDLMTLNGKSAANTALQCGTATLGDGIAYGGMGVDWGDYDNDGKLDLIVGTFRDQAKVIFRNLGEAFELQSSESLGMASSIPRVTFGTKWIDFDNDGWLDVMFANGHIQDNISDIVLVKNIGTVYRQPVMLYRNLGGRGFEDNAANLSETASRPIVGRGVAIGDYDNDGRMDALVVDSEGAPILMHNVTETRGNYLFVSLEGRRCNRDGYGAILTAQVGARKFVRYCHTDGSYLSASDKRVHFGLGAATKIDKLTVKWPDGKSDEFTNIPAGCQVTLREGDKEYKTKKLKHP